MAKKTPPPAERPPSICGMITFDSKNKKISFDVMTVRKGEKKIHTEETPFGGDRRSEEAVDFGMLIAEVFIDALNKRQAEKQAEAKRFESEAKRKKKSEKKGK